LNAGGFGDVDIWLARAGRHEKIYEKLGAHLVEGGVRFAVWAPNATFVSVVGDFNSWDSAASPLGLLGETGIWEGFVEGAAERQCYKFHIDGRNKADPYAFRAEVPPKTASVIFESHHVWQDADWVAARRAQDPLERPVSMYEVHAPSWRRGLGWRELADQLGPYVKDLGFTHVELMPVMQHPFEGSWGYQVTGYYAPQSTLGTPDDFRAFVDGMHGHGIGVILDWVPAHFPRDAWALAEFDGTHLYEHADPRRGQHPDWGTLVFNLGRTEVRNFLLANALFWLREYHVDGLRVDAVASMLYLDYSRKAGEWIPNEFGGREDLDSVSFLKELNELVHSREPGAISAAEESTAWPGVSRPTYLGGLGFGLKWNLGWMHDTLAYFSHEPVHRRYHHNELTFSLVYAWTENFILPLSHDEVVHGKRSLLQKLPGDRWQQLANLRSVYAYMWAHPGKKLLFMGSELADPAEWRPRARPEPVLPRRACAVGGRLLAGGVPLDRAERRVPQRGRVRADLQRQREPPGVRREPVAGPARELSPGVAAGRALAGGAEHGLRALRRIGRRQPRRRRGRGQAVARPRSLGARHGATARRHLVSAGDWSD
jgi:1,4-alpha-glucan branching enzyme